MRNALLSILDLYSKDIIDSCVSPKTAANIKSYINYIKSQLTDQEVWFPNTIYLIERTLKNYEKQDDVRKIDYLRSRVYIIYRALKYELEKKESSDSSSYNSNEYFQRYIDELKARLDELEKHNSEESETIKLEKEETQKQLRKILYEFEQQKKKDDASDKLEKDFSLAFAKLKKHIEPLISEKKRLNWMFYVYAVLSLIVLVGLIILEFVYISKWDTANESWVYYLRYYIPVPLAGALLWAFIYQMNRAQRQLVLLSNQLYLIDYIEGILMTIPVVSPNVDIAAEKISNVLEDMVRRYINVPNILSEDTLDKAFSRDSIDIHALLDWAKNVKDVIK